jgi:biopolymer transport protein ExbD
MKLTRATGRQEQVRFDMTPMIDCCFQLIIFFMLTLKILAPEGDFTVKMPSAMSEGVPDPLQLPPIKVKLKAQANGRLDSIQFGSVVLGGKDPFHELHLKIREIVKDDVGPGSTASKTEVEFDCDPHLHYEYTMRAITAVSGYLQGDRVVRLVEKIKFSPRRPD